MSWHQEQGRALLSQSDCLFWSKGEWVHHRVLFFSVPFFQQLDCWANVKVQVYSKLVIWREPNKWTLVCLEIWASLCFNKQKKPQPRTSHFFIWCNRHRILQGAKSSIFYNINRRGDGATRETGASLCWFWVLRWETRRPTLHCR